MTKLTIFIVVSCSVFNNDKDLMSSKGNKFSIAFEDQNKAIELSRNKGAAAAKAYTQQGLIHRLNEVEEKALEDFSKATELGSAFAKTIVVQVNSYATMCNKMLAQAINKLKGEPQ